MARKRIGELLVDKGLMTREQVETALKESQRRGELIGKTMIRLGLVSGEQLLQVLAEQLGIAFYPNLGQLLVSKGLASPQQMEAALRESQRRGEILGKTILRMGLVAEEQFLQVLAEQLGITFAPSLKEVQVADQLIKVVPARFVLHYKFMPLELKGTVMKVAVSDPMAVWVTEDLRLNLGYDIERVLAPEKEIQAAIRRYYGVGSETVEQILTRDVAGREAREAQDLAKVEEIEDVTRSADDASVIKLVNQLLSEAVTSRASDVHIEPFRERVRVRYRIDGILYDMHMPDEMRYLHSAIVSRIKIVSKLNVVERRLPQDGRAIIKIQEQQVDLRISIIPGLYGENVVIRILPVELLLTLEDLGFLPSELKMLQALMQQPHGVVFVTGPTGSGKTTTLYACLSVLNKEAVKVVTIEDPIEYELGGIMQFQVKPEIGLTFAAALRSILRHDPDIVMVGEVRDLETAELAIRTALTGHLIFSTLHTNDAASGATRLLNIGIEPYLIASSVNAFISQRLVRVICPECKTERKDTDLLPEQFRHAAVSYGKGCDACKSIGYRGRTAIHEIILLAPEIQELILNKASAAQIRQRAKALGFRTLFDAGVEKVHMGITTPEEVLRVTEPEALVAARTATTP